MIFLWTTQGEDGVPGEDGRKVRKPPFSLNDSGGFQILIVWFFLFFWLCLIAQGEKGESGPSGRNVRQSYYICPFHSPLLSLAE